MIQELRLFKTLENLTGEGSQKAKQIIISDNLSDRFSYMLDICYNPFVTTKLHKISFNEALSDTNHNHWEDFKKLIEELKTAPAANDLLRGRAHDLVSQKISEDPQEDLELRTVLMKILTKRMNIGIGAKLINKAVKKELIPDPSLMLATDDHETIEKWDKIYCEEKYDGVRVIALYKNGEFSYFTRAFNELDSSCFPKITFDLKTCLINSGLKGDWFFDGELTDLNRKSVSGKVTQILRGKVDSSIESGLLFNVFDFEEASSLEKGSGVIDYKTRRDTLEKILHYIASDSPVKLAQMWELSDPSEVTAIYKKIVDLGGEGVICKDNGVYECKRSKSWVKFKEVSDCDLEITGWYPGEGKREGFIGGFILTDSSRTLNVKVGAGFTDNDLKTLSQDPDSHIGKIAAIQYNVTITDKHGNRSLFLPRFIEVRSDKNSPDDFSGKF
jgi:DNA ligase-1